MTPNTKIEQTMFAIARGERALRHERKMLETAKAAGANTGQSERRVRMLERAQAERMAQLAVVLAPDKEAPLH